MLTILRPLSIGMSGHDVTTWQEFLAKQGLYRGEVNGYFNSEVMQATVDFQRLHELPIPEGEYGDLDNRTLGMAMVLGLQMIPEPQKPQV